MLYRKIESVISSWITDDKRALLIDGARQVGKTFTIRKVLKVQNCEYIEFNLLENYNFFNGLVVVFVVVNKSRQKKCFFYNFFFRSLQTYYFYCFLIFKSRQNNHFFLHFCFQK